VDEGHFKLPSSAHASWEDACAVWLHNSTILGWAALGEAVKTMEKLTIKIVDWLKISKYLGGYVK
jgi:hypothetical protein